MDCKLMNSGYAGKTFLISHASRVHHKHFGWIISTSTLTRKITFQKICVYRVTSHYVLRET
jgi:hypothetical protein